MTNVTVADRLHELSLCKNEMLRQEERMKNEHVWDMTEFHDMKTIENAVIVAFDAIIESCYAAAINQQFGILDQRIQIDLCKSDFHPSYIMKRYFRSLMEAKFEREGFSGGYCCGCVDDVQFTPRYALSGNSYILEFRYSVRW